MVANIHDHQVKEMPEQEDMSETNSQHNARTNQSSNFKSKNPKTQQALDLHDLDGNADKSLNNLKDQSSRIPNAYLEPNSGDKHMLVTPDPNASGIKKDLLVNKTEIHMFEQDKQDSLVAFTEENKSALLTEGISEQLVEEIIKIAFSFDKLRQLARTSKTRIDKDLGEEFESKF